MAPALEILRARKTDLFKTEGVKSIQGALDTLNKTDGHIASYVGTEIQDPDFWYAIIGTWIHRYRGEYRIMTLGLGIQYGRSWLITKPSSTTTKSIPTSPSLSLKVAANIDFMYHSLPSTSTPEAALEAPVTEVLFWNLKEGIDKEEFKKLENEFSAKVLPSDAVKNRVGFGSVVEDERKISAVLGWVSIENFKKTIATPRASEYIGKLKALAADVQLKHAEFKKDTSKA